ncbi:MraY family glycosyltransferase [Zestomonas thermotolerans]|jgi:Fuc2NAc and GlcNAc transferase|uniref:MraY family glycosyltransferase n=1 Tax=Zestomonas thermotolerans TaxID=157784 RepID=UPI000475CDC0|nr:glycosyltransferase family 4 protein [Pseudomonas thermotolerans]MBO2509967.1 glycosyl transferase [Gammaproteobacteria bacterium]
MELWWLLPVVAGLSFGLTAALLHYARAQQLLDVPNSRSSHSVPTPRGGGVAIVLSFVAALPLLYLADALPWSHLWALLGAGVGVAGIGFLDDHVSLPVRWRLLVHAVCAAWMLGWLGGLPALEIFGIGLEAGWLGAGLGLLYLVWLLNLYNFMDGLDGIAAVEAISVCLGGALLYWVVGQGGHMIVLLVLACAVAGFLGWNWPPARIFMGDVGSGFLGIVLGGLSLQAAWAAPELFWSWLILLGVFIVDATWTLLRRLLRGEKLHQAHRSHAYQVASRRFGGHLPVTLAVGAINLFWLLPMALWVGSGGMPGTLGVLLAYLPLGGLAWWFQAGADEE